MSIKLGIGCRSGVAPCHYSCSACSAFQRGCQEGGNYLVTHERQVSSLEGDVSKHCLLVHFINWKTFSVWLTPAVLYTLVAPDHSSKHGVSLIIFLLLCPHVLNTLSCADNFIVLFLFSPSSISKYSCLSTQCAGNALSKLLYEAPLNVYDGKMVKMIYKSYIMWSLHQLYVLLTPTAPNLLSDLYRAHKWYTEDTKDGVGLEMFYL